ncbi:PREDICTED: pancreatic lipase-related protein 2-like [Ceratosolen solmsi marchali]|uniref:phospholipase A1 n=1 Tax=Ceratosolen solmsi marchali TaxID=326594 RepID=A0AAJ7E1C6_9HYME|nr:PREDICTED: pancreatic lipase-related protein 2-like [Ceratosolen solmsi marchali]
MFSHKYSLVICIYTLVLPSSCVVKDILTSAIGISGIAPDYQNKINLILYQGLSVQNAKSYKYSLAESTELKNHLDIKLPFVLYVHGFIEHYSNESVQTIISAYLQKGADNIVILDWSAFSYENYAILSKRIKTISMFTARALEDLAKAEILNVDTLHIVSHSLGSHLAGFLGRFLSFTIPRITALDPANPLFYQLNAEHIDNSSAEIVDVIHTDGGMYGANPRTGTIDFFANGGIRPQPGCPAIGMCNHHRSWRFYSESVLNDTAFPGLACASFEDFKAEKCKENEIVYFGYSMTAKRSGGAYYFTTNKASPYGKGSDGLKYV